MIFDTSIPYVYTQEHKSESEAYEEPFPEPNVDKDFYCTPDTVYLGDLVVLHFPMPHNDEELALRTPKEELYFIHQPFERRATDGEIKNSIISDNAFNASSQLSFPTKTFKARPYVYGAKKKIVFDETGYYEFEMATNLEDDSGVRGITTGVYFINQHRKK